MAGVGQRERSSRSSTSSSRPSSWSGSSALSCIPQTTSVGTCTFGKGAQQPVGQRHRHARRRHDHLRRAIPVEHRGQRARLRPFGDILPLLGLRDLRQVDMAGEGLVEERSRSPSPRPPSRSPASRKAVIYCERRAGRRLSIRLFWKMTGCGALTIARRVSRGSPRSAAAQAIAPPQSWPTSAKRSSAKRIGQREDVVDQHVGLVVARRPAAGRMPAKPRWSGMTRRKSSSSRGAISRQVRCDSGKPWSRMTARLRRIAGERDVERDAGAKRDPR